MVPPFQQSNETSVCIKEITPPEELDNYQFLKEDLETRSLALVFWIVIRKCKIVKWLLAIVPRILPAVKLVRNYD